MKKGIPIAAAASVLMFLVLRWQGSELKNNLSPRGIIDLELAGTPGAVSTLLAHWNHNVVSTNIWLDFLFIIAYTLFLAMACITCADKWPANSMPAKAGMLFARLAYLAGLFDVAENLLMLQTINGNFSDRSLQVTVYCASAKFIIAAMIVVYLAASYPFVLRKK